MNFSRKSFWEQQIVAVHLVDYFPRLLSHLINRDFIFYLEQSSCLSCAGRPITWWSPGKLQPHLVVEKLFNLVHPPQVLHGSRRSKESGYRVAKKLVLVRLHQQLHESHRLRHLQPEAKQNRQKHGNKVHNHIQNFLVSARGEVSRVPMSYQTMRTALMLLSLRQRQACRAERRLMNEQFE